MDQIFDIFISDIGPDEDIKMNFRNIKLIHRYPAFFKAGIGPDRDHNISLHISIVLLPELRIRVDN